MPAVWVRVRTELRERWRAVVALAIVAGMAGGLVMAAAAGARRTDSAIARFRVASNAAQVFLPNSPGGMFGFAELDYEIVERLPQVADSARSWYVAMTARTEAGLELTPLPDQNPFISFTSPDGKYDQVLNRMHVIEGRLPDQDAEHEVVLSVPAADAYDIAPGEVLEVKLARFEDFNQAFATGKLAPSGPALRLDVVGIMASPGELPPGLGYPSMHLTQAFYRQYEHEAMLLPALHVQLHRDEDVGAFREAVEREAIVPTGDGGDAPQVQFASEVELSEVVQRTAHLQAVALWLLALAGSVVALFVFGQALTRQAFAGAADHHALAALGMTRMQLTAAGIIRAALTSLLAATVAVVIAVLLSPLAPIGIAELAEVDPGVRVDPFVLVVGVLAVVTGFVVVGVLPSWLAARSGAHALGDDRRRRTSMLGGLLARVVRSPGAAVGARLALEPGRGRTAVPVRSTLAGVAIGIASLTVAFSIGASFERLTADPAAVGWTWDGAVGNDFDPDRGDIVIPLLRGEPAVAAFAGGAAVSLTVGERSLPVLGLDEMQGRIAPKLLAGRAPSSPDEVALGSRSMRELRTRLGASIVVSGRGGERSVRVVGRAVIPPIVEGDGLGIGGLMTFDGLRRSVPGAVRNIWVYRLVAGADADAVVASLRADAQGIPVLDRPEAATLLAFARVDRLPVTLASVVALFAAATLAHAMGSAVRRRRRDLAILKTLGFLRGQVRRAVAWQASTLAVVGLAVGIPVGIACGRWAWALYASQQGFASEPALPGLAVLLVIPATIVLANLIAAFPARSAARTAPASILRAE